MGFAMGLWNRLMLLEIAGFDWVMRVLVFGYLFLAGCEGIGFFSCRFCDENWLPFCVVSLSFLNNNSFLKDGNKINWYQWPWMAWTRIAQKGKKQKFDSVKWQLIVALLGRIFMLKEKYNTKTKRKT
jgi:hypothetical protein